MTPDSDVQHDTAGTPDAVKLGGGSRPTRPVRRARRVAVGLIVTAALCGAGYTAAAVAAPLPSPRLELAAQVPPLVADAAAAQALVDGLPLPTAIGWEESDAVWANDAASYSLASLSKLITVLVTQDTRPLAPGAEGITHVWTDRDAEQQQEYLADDGVAYPIPAGTEVTERQMLTLIFLPSANDFVSAYVRSVFGTEEAFLVAVDEWKVKHQINSLEFVEPSGMDERNKANAADLVRVARLALAHPTISEFTSVVSAEMPWGIGTVENTNPLLTELPGMRGIKTGRSASAGFNLIAAQSVDALGRSVTKISVTLGRGSIEERAQSGREVLAAMDALPQQVVIVEQGAVVGEAVSADGVRRSLETTAEASAVLLPGEAVSSVAALGALPQSPAGDRADNAVVGTVTATGPFGEIEVPVVLDGEFEEPDLWWRLTNPTILWG